MMAPYAAPLLAIDQIVRLDEAGIITRKAIAGNEPYLDGHYPDYPIYPGVFIIEAVHQAARAYAERFAGDIRLEEVRSTRFLSALHPGDVLECACQCERIDDGSRLGISATCRHDDVTAATVKAVYRIESAHVQSR